MNMKAAVENFVRVYNEPGSEVYPLYGASVDWIEMPSGRRGGRDELFAALRQARSHFINLHMEAISITADETTAVLESEIALKTTAEDSALRVRTIWFFGFADGKIVKEHDYSFVLKS